MEVNELFIVYEKGVWENDERAHARRPKAVKVYDVHIKNGYPYFLICENGEWQYRGAKDFTDAPMQYEPKAE